MRPGFGSGAGLGWAGGERCRAFRGGALSLQTPLDVFLIVGLWP